MPRYCPSKHIAGVTAWAIPLNRPGSKFGARAVDLRSFNCQPQLVEFYMVLQVDGFGFMPLVLSRISTLLSELQYLVYKITAF